MPADLQPNELEDAVALDLLLILATAPLWLARLVWLVTAGAWNDWRSGQ